MATPPPPEVAVGTAAKSCHGFPCVSYAQAHPEKIQKLTNEQFSGSAASNTSAGGNMIMEVSLFAANFPVPAPLKLFDSRRRAAPAAGSRKA